MKKAVRVWTASEATIIFALIIGYLPTASSIGCPTVPKHSPILQKTALITELTI